MADRWWVVPESVLVDLLTRASEGEDPGILMVELDANCETHRPDDD